jgi:spore coat assembly protein
MEINVGDIVTRTSYRGDIFFRVDDIKVHQGNPLAMLYGLFCRLCADAPVGDLEKMRSVEIDAYRKENGKRHSEMVMRAMKSLERDYQPRLQCSKKEIEGNNFFMLPGKVLHLDGDDEYRSLCQQRYLQLGVPCRVVHVHEEKQPEVVKDYLSQDRPDILVLTGHDSMVKGTRDIYEMKNYRHSKYFVEAVRKAREYEPDLDDLIIIAGGCKSYFEALIEAGANFASSPKRVMIQVLDPLLLAQHIAFTSIYDRISLPQFLGVTMTGLQGIGGVQTRGKLRLGTPRTRCIGNKKKL